MGAKKLKDAAARAPEWLELALHPLWVLSLEENDGLDDLIIELHHQTEGEMDDIVAALVSVASRNPRWSLDRLEDFPGGERDLVLEMAIDAVLREENARNKTRAMMAVVANLELAKR